MTDRLRILGTATAVAVGRNPDMMDKRVALTWHDVTCPYAQGCPDRDAHSQRLTMVKSGALDRFLAQLPVTSKGVLELERQRDVLRRALADLVEAATKPPDALLASWHRAREVLNEIEGPSHPETKFPTLAADDDLPTRAEVLAELAHDDLCDSPGPHCGCGTAQTVDKMVEHGWLRFADEPGGQS